MARVPDEAIRRRRELSQGAWDLYVVYCMYRNRETGQCNPGRQLLMEEMTPRSYTHVSRLKAELVREAWIAPEGRDAVILLVGKFPPLKVQTLRKTANLVCEKPQTSDQNFAENRKLVCGKPQTSDASPIYEPVEEPVAAATASAAEFDASPEQEEARLRAPVTDEFVEEVILSGVYLEAHVRFVWGKLKLHCAASSTVPIRKQLLWWLSQERGSPPVQPGLPGVGAEVTAMPVARASPGRQCDATCRLCYGSGWQTVAGAGAKRCSGTPAKVAGQELGGESADEELQREQTG